MAEYMGEAAKTTDIGKVLTQASEMIINLDVPAGLTCCQHNQHF